jgi:beta-lactamase superfamily II metal-dependent hydrolase
VYPGDAPGPDVFEVSLFGPGTGECIVVHLPGGVWLVIDSCLDEREPVALRYLQAISVSPASIALVVATHWHDDHVRGLSKVLEVATQATFGCSIALNRAEFVNLVASSNARRRNLQLSSGLEEFYAILTNLRQRGEQPLWMNHDQVVLRERATVTSLSPSDEAVTRGFQGLHALMPSRGGAVRALPNPGPNELSVVLQAEVGAASVLLGADLEVTTSARNGWSAIVNSPNRPMATAQVFKVPHHGSPNAHLPEVWDQMLDSNVVAALTPYRQSGLPRPPDLERMVALASGGTYLTAPVRAQEVVRDKGVVRTLKEVSRRPPVPKVARMGLVRLRLDPASGVVTSCEVFGTAARVP